MSFSNIQVKRIAGKSTKKAFIILCVVISMFLILSSVKSFADETSTESNKINFYHQYDQKTKEREKYTKYEDIWMKYKQKDKYGQTQATIGTTGCSLFAGLHAYQWLFGRFGSIDEQADMAKEIIKKLNGIAPYDGAGPGAAASFCTSNGAMKINVKKNTKAIQEFFDVTHGALYHHVSGGMGHYMISVGYTYHDIDGKRTFLLHAVDSSSGTTIKNAGGAYDFDTFKKLSVKNNKVLNTPLKYHQGGQYWKELSGIGVSWGIYNPNKLVKPSTIEIRNVAYPKKMKIDTSKGWDLQTGIVISNQKLSKINVWIEKKDTHEKISKMSSPKNISDYGYVFFINQLDDGKENGQKFSKITQEGDYIWHIEATDAAGRPASVDMEFHAGKNIGTEVASKSSTDTSTTAEYVDRNFGKEYYSISTTVRPINPNTGLYYQPYSDSQKMLTVNQNDELHVQSVVLNDFNNYWLQVEYQGGTYYLCANMVQEYFVGPRQFVKISDFEYPKGDYKLKTVNGQYVLADGSIPMHGTITSISPITEVMGGWYLLSTQQPVNNNFVKTVPVNREREFDLTKSKINQELIGNNLAKLGPGIYYFQLRVTYLIYKNVTNAKDEPFETVYWYPTPKQMVFTVGGSKTTSTQTVPVNSISLNSTEFVLKTGEIRTLIATVLPSDATTKTVSWKSSNNDVAIVENGKIIAHSKGTAEISVTAQDGSNKQATCTVTVIQPVTEIIVSPSVLTMYVGDTIQQLSTTVNPSNANNKNVTWSSSNSNIASVNSNGQVTAKSAGTATITALAADGSGKLGTCSVEVRSYVDSVSVSGSETVNVGNTIKLSAAVSPSDAYDKSILWSSSNETIATVDSNGNVTGRNPGSVTITAKATDRGTRTDSKTITVIQPVSGIALSGTGNILRGKSSTISAVVSPTNASNKTLAWSSDDTSIATVNNGSVTAKKAGSTTIWATATDGSGVKASFFVTVKEPVAQITIAGGEIVPVDGTISLTANISPTNAGNKSVSWSIDPSTVATINSQGVVKGIKAGTATVTATATDGSGVSATCSIRVVKQIVAVQIFGDSSVYTGQNKQLTATVTSDQPLGDTGVNWSSSNSAVVSVSSNGTIHGEGNGTAIITATSRAENYYSASLTVTVTTLVNKITVSGNGALDEKNTSQLTASVSPSTATNKNVIWSSSNTAVARVDSNGNVNAVSEGTAVITATAADGGGASGLINITVYPLPKTVSIKGVDSLLVGKTAQLSATVLPTNARNRNVTWASSDSTVATVNASGLVTAKANGTVVITATSQSNNVVSNSHEITITTLVSSINLTAPERINVGNTDTVIATVLPATASNKTLRWTSSDEELAIVDSEGNVTALAPGFVTITASTTDGSGVKQETEIEMFQPVQSISIDMDAYAYVGQTLILQTKICPENASNPMLDYFVDNENIAAIGNEKDVDGQYYQLYLHDTGLIKLTAKAVDGSNVSGFSYIMVLPYTELKQNTADYTIYLGGTPSGKTIGKVSLTTDCVHRVSNEKHGASWNIEHVSGDYAIAIGINENMVSNNGFNLVNSVDLDLLRINRTGTDVYRVSCTINGNTASCDVTIHAEQPAAPLPQSVNLSTSTYNAQVGDVISINTASRVLQPSGAALPGETDVSLYGQGAFNRYANVTMDDDIFTVTFSKAGTYSAYVRYSGSNYEYDANVNFVITTASGTVPPDVEAISIDSPVKYLLAGETSSFDIDIVPSAADEAALQWSSSDPEVISVGADGTLTALKTGTSIITVTADNGISATGYVAVTETLLSIDWNDDEIIEVYVGGSSRTVIQRIYLTPRASAQLTEAPAWTLKRSYGNNLTLQCEPITGRDSSGQDLYGCAIILKSVSGTGMTEYELTCSDGMYSTSSVIKVNANEVEDNLPSMISWSNATFTGRANELISVRPVIVCWPEGTTLPDSAVISVDGDQYWEAALNPGDYTVSRSAMNFSFNAPGIYTANIVYTCSNMKYLVPVTVRVTDSSGNVPVRLMRATLNESEVSVEPGNTIQLSVALAPVDATNKAVTWSSSDTSIATVNADGLVTGVAKGRTTVWCTPSDSNCAPVECTVVVEDAFTVTKYEEMTTQYLQGETGFAVARFEISKGTLKRIEAEGVNPVWKLKRVSGNAAEVALKDRNGSQYIVVTGLLAGGTDVYKVTCTAGTHTWSGQVSFTVTDLGTGAPASVTIAETQYTVDVGEETELDFTPICTPGNAAVPSELRASYIGIGEFYNGLVDSYRTSVLTARTDKIKVAFKKPGIYLLSRYYRSCNLSYVTECRISVGSGKMNLLTCTDTDPVVYIGGKSSIVSTCIITDNSIEELYGDEIIWKAEKLTGDCLTVALRADQSSASLYVVNAKETGQEVWRVSCTFRGITDYVDVTIDALEARTGLPETVTLYQTAFSGMIGNTVHVPLAVQCLPDGTALPSTENEAWSFATDGNTAAHAEWSFSDNQMNICFSESGYYGGQLIYKAGNVSYSFPITFAVTDEESVQAVPAHMDVSVSRDTVTVYPEGETNVPIVNAVLSDSLDAYSISSIAAYAERCGTAWTLETVSGTACSLSVQQVNAASVRLLLDSISGTGNVVYRIKCTIAGTTYSAQGTVHVAKSSEARPQPEMQQSYFVTPTGTSLTIDASFYDRTSSAKLCDGKDSIWDNAEALAAMGYEYKTSGDLWLPVFYEAGNYTTTVTNMIGNLPCSQEIRIAAYTARNLPASASMLTFPSALKTIDDEAFMGVSVNVVDLRGTNISSIGAYSFANIGDLMRVYVPASVRSIDPTAFSGCRDFVICCVEGSYADSWAKQAGYPVIYDMN